VASALAVMGAGSVVAYAFFTSTGSGFGTASVGSATNWTVAVSSDSSNHLYPGSGSETLSFTITNAGAGAQQLNTVVASVGDSAGPTGTCMGIWFTAVPTTAGLPVVLAHDGTYTGTILVTMQDSGTNQNACQGLLTPPVTITAG
jgi:hypothetical protein